MLRFPRLILFIALFLASQATQAESAPWVDEYVPPTGDYSWVQLTSGEWLKGEIIALYNESLGFDSDHFGDIAIDLDDIATVHGRGIFVVSFTDGEPVYGKLNIRGETVVITAQDGHVEIHREDLVSITPAAERERDRWAGDISLGLNARRGNTEISEIDVRAGLLRRTPVSRFVIDYIGNTNETDGVRVADSHRVNLSIDRFTGGRFYWRPLSVQYYRDELQNISHQGTLDTGFGYHLADTQRTTWDVNLGAGGNYLENVSVAVGESNGKWSPVGTLGTDLNIDITSWMEWELLVNMNFLSEEAGRYQHHIVSTLSNDIFGGIDLDFSIIWDRTEKPQIAEDGTVPEKDDYRMVVSLSYDF